MSHRSILGGRGGGDAGAGDPTAGAWVAIASGSPHVAGLPALHSGREATSATIALGAGVGVEGAGGAWSNAEETVV